MFWEKFDLNYFKRIFVFMYCTVDFTLLNSKVISSLLLIIKT